MSSTSSFARLAAVMAAACIVLSGCASSSDDASDTPAVRPSDNSLPPSTPESQNAPTAGPANGDPHAFNP
jgi:hypothetical protein